MDLSRNDSNLESVFSALWLNLGTFCCRRVLNIQTSIIEMHNSQMNPPFLPRFHP